MTVIAGVVGRPITHSLSPILHNAWLDGAGVDGVYMALEPLDDGSTRVFVRPTDPETTRIIRDFEMVYAPAAQSSVFEWFVRRLQRASVRGLNVTLPFKEQALALADRATDRARRAGAANVLLFEPGGGILADNTDGVGLLGAFAAQAPTWTASAGRVVVLGAGGAARGAVAALIEAGTPSVFVVNRTFRKAEAIAGAFGQRVTPLPIAEAERALDEATAVINATSAGLAGQGELNAPLEATPDDCVVMDMVYKPLETPFLAKARALGRPTVDGLAMLIGQARPSFEAFFGAPPPDDVDVRSLALAHLETAR